MPIIRPVVDGLNAVRSNVWSVMLIGAGLILILKGHPQEGGSLITGAFAVFRSSKDEVTPSSIQVNSPLQNPIVGS